MEAVLRQYDSRLGPRARRERIPLTCTFELTPTCNLRCRFCYVALDPYKGPYLSTEQVLRILDTLEEAGVLYLTLTGGEILARRDFAEIYLYAKRKGFLVTLFTNATMMNERIAALLREHPPLLVEVSIYGADAEHYEYTTQIPGSFARFTRGIDLLQQSGVKLLLKTPISKITENHLDALVEFARVRELPYKIDPVVDARHDGGKEPMVYRLEVRRAQRVIEQMDDLDMLHTEDGTAPRAAQAAAVPAVPAAASAAAQPAGGRRGPLPECADTSPDAAESLYQCGAGRTGFFIDGLGNASHCVIDREPAFSLLTERWADVWEKIGRWVTQPLPKEAPCSGCTLRSTCNNCPARARLATGSPYLKDTYLCDLTHLEHGLEPAEHPDYSALAKRPLGACVV